MHRHRLKHTNPSQSSRPCSIASPRAQAHRGGLGARPLIRAMISASPVAISGGFNEIPSLLFEAVPCFAVAYLAQPSCKVSFTVVAEDSLQNITQGCRKRMPIASRRKSRKEYPDVRSGGAVLNFRLIPGQMICFFSYRSRPFSVSSLFSFRHQIERIIRANPITNAYVGRPKFMAGAVVAVVDCNTYLIEIIREESWLTTMM
jgi:hypothetical protein